MPPGSDVGNMSILGYDPARFHTGRAPIEAASLGLRLPPRPGRLPLQPGDRRRRRDDGRLRRRSPVTDEAADVIAALRRRARSRRTVARSSSTPGVQYRHILVAPADWADADCAPPHDLSEQPACGPPARPPEAPRVDGGQPRRSSAGFGLAANQIWLWGQGFQPPMPCSRRGTACGPALVTAVDLIRGLGVLTDIERRRGRRVPPAGYDTNYEGKRDAALRALRTGPDLFVIHVEATDEAGHAGDLDEKVRALEAWDRRILAGLVQGLDELGPWRLLLLPDHATPVGSDPHNGSGPVPAGRLGEDGPGGTYTEAATAGASTCRATTSWRDSCSGQAEHPVDVLGRERLGRGRLGAGEERDHELQRQWVREGVRAEGVTTNTALRREGAAQLGDHLPAEPESARPLAAPRQ